MKKRLICIFTLIALCATLTGCDQFFSSLGDAINDAFEEEEGSGGEVVFPDGEEEPPNEWVDGAAVESGAIPVQLMLGSSADLSEHLNDADGLEWHSECPAVASVSGGVVTANKVGRTEIVARLGGEVAGRFVVTCEFMISGGGFDFTTTKVDGTTYEVESLYEANRILDLAAANHIQKLTIDFSAISESFNVKTDFDLNSEFGSHTSLKMLYYPSTSYLVEFEIIYNTDAASYTTPLSGDYDYPNIHSANAIIRAAYAAQSGDSRADDYEGFAINSAPKTFDVYNSEELWWAVEQGYRPTFPISNTKAELFYERAKMILRDIVTDGMTDYEKALAIYEYLIETVSYDYDAYYNVKSVDEEKNNTCYYLEGVFEQGRAVCDGKSKAFVLLCGIEGIDCVRAFGSATGGGVGHAWNYIKLGEYWYMVDTTEGDMRYETTSSLSSFFGGKFEAVGYESFLMPAYTHSEKYEYTEMWANIIPAENNYSYPDDYFDYDLGESSYDFTINSNAEALALFEKLGEGGMPDKFILSFVPQSTFMMSSYFAGIENSLGVDMEIYSVQYGEETVYLALFKAVK